jgi:hypothetical protein
MNDSLDFDNLPVCGYPFTQNSMLGATFKAKFL